MNLENEIDLTTYMYDVCFPFTEAVDVHELLGLWTSVDPCGADVAIQIQTYVFSTPNGEIPISSIAHLRSITDKVAGLEQIGRRVEGILEVLQENVEVVQKVRELVHSSLDLEIPDEFPENDYSLRHTRTASLTNAIRSIGSAPLNPVATLAEVGPAFDLERARFFFQGQLPHHERLTHGQVSTGVAAARIFTKIAEHPGLMDFVTSTEFDSIVVKMDLAIRFYNDFTLHLERSIMYFQAMTKTYETASTFIPDCDDAARRRSYKRVRPRESTLDIAIREGVFTPAPVNAADAVVTAPPVVVVAPAPAAAAVPVPVVTPPTVEHGGEPNATPEARRYLPRLPAPLGFEPAAMEGSGGDEAGEEADEGDSEGGASSSSGRRQNPCPVRPPCASALFAKCAELHGLFMGHVRPSQLYARIPDEHVIKQRLDDFFQRDLRVRYFPTLAKILVNYASRDPKVRTRRIGYMSAHHKVYVRELYIQEHARVVAGGDVPSLEELMAPHDFTDSIRAIFAEGELQQLVAPFIV